MLLIPGSSSLDGAGAIHCFAGLRALDGFCLPGDRLANLVTPVITSVFMYTVPVLLAQ